MIDILDNKEVRNCSKSIVSVIVIGYNVEKYIETCLTSILNQDYPSIEIIVVDDGSQDETKKIVTDILGQRENTYYIYQQNSGANEARITGYHQAKGNYIMFVDGDDYLEENCISALVRQIEKNDYDCVGFNYILEKEDGSKVENPVYCSGKYNDRTYIELILEEKLPHYIWNKIFKREYLARMKFDEIPKITMGDDFAMNVRMGIKDVQILMLEQSYYHYIEHGTSVSRKFNDKYIEILDALGDIEDTLKKCGLYHEENEKRLDFSYYRIFTYYIVRNKYKTTPIHKQIYRAYKNRKIKLKHNSYIKQWSKYRTKLERILVRCYLINYSLGYFVSRLGIMLMNIRNRGDK